MAAAIAGEYRALITAAASARQGSPVKRQTVARLRRELRRISQRDYFPPPERDVARRAVESLASGQVAR
jgi:cobalamin biosynthesis protein CobD/CbiB